MSRNQEELSIRMRLRNKPVDELTLIVNGDYTDLEKKIAGEFLSKHAASLGEPAETPTPEPVKVEPQEAVPTSDAPVADAAPRPVPKRKNGKPLLSPEEEERLNEAEADFDKRQAARKTPSRSGMPAKKSSTGKDKSLRETKRQAIDASEEVKGLKVGSKVCVPPATSDVYTVVKLYRSSDGKEKCLIQKEGEKPLKKRVTSIQLVED